MLTEYLKNPDTSGHCIIIIILLVIIIFFYVRDVKSPFLSGCTTGKVGDGGPPRPYRSTNVNATNDPLLDDRYMPPTRVTPSDATILNRGQNSNYPIQPAMEPLPANAIMYAPI